MSDSAVTPRHALWLVAHAAGAAPLDAQLVVNLFSLAQEHFVLSGPTHASFGPDDHGVVREPQQWLAAHSAQMTQCHMDSPYCSTQLSMWRIHKTRPSWTLEVNTFGVNGLRSSPTLCLRVDILAAKTDASVYSFAREAASAIMSNTRVWYGFIDVCDIAMAPKTATYSCVGVGYNDSWEHLVEQEVWSEYALAAHRTVRNVYWGNILGPELAHRLRQAEYERYAAHLDNTTPHGRPVEMHADSGAVALFLDDNPVAFAQHRDSGLAMEQLGSMSRCVKTAGMLRWVMSRAGML